MIPLPQIANLMAEQSADPSKRPAQRRLAHEVIAIVYGLPEAEKLAFEQGLLFRTPVSASSPTKNPTSGPQYADINPVANPNAPQVNAATTTTYNATVPRSLVRERPMSHVLHVAGLVASRGEGQRLVAAGAAYVTGRRGHDVRMQHDLSFVPIKNPAPGAAWPYVSEDESRLILRVGKWKVRVVKLVDDEEGSVRGGNSSGARQSMRDDTKKQRRKPEKRAMRVVDESLEEEREEELEEDLRDGLEEELEEDLKEGKRRTVDGHNGQQTRKTKINPGQQEEEQEGETIKEVEGDEMDSTKPAPRSEAGDPKHDTLDHHAQIRRAERELRKGSRLQGWLFHQVQSVRDDRANPRAARDAQTRTNEERKAQARDEEHKGRAPEDRTRSSSDIRTAVRKAVWKAQRESLGPSAAHRAHRRRLQFPNSPPMGHPPPGGDDQSTTTSPSDPDGEIAATGSKPDTAAAGDEVPGTDPPSVNWRPGTTPKTAPTRLESPSTSAPPRGMESQTEPDRREWARERHWQRRREAAEAGGTESAARTEPPEDPDDEVPDWRVRVLGYPTKEKKAMKKARRKAKREAMRAARELRESRLGPPPVGRME